MPKQYIIKFVDPSFRVYTHFEGLYEVCVSHLNSLGIQLHEAEWWEVKKLKPVGEYVFKFEE